MTFEWKENWNSEIRRFGIKHSVYIYLFIFLWSQSLNIWKILWVFPIWFFSNKNKNKLFSLHSLAFFKILKEPMLAQKEKYLILKHQYSAFMSRKYKGVALSWRKPRSPSLKFLIIFLSEVVEAIWGWWIKKWMFHIKFPYLRIPKIIDFWLECH